MSVLVMKTYTTKWGAKLPLSAAIVQKIETATVNDARRWSETQDKAAFIVEFLDLVSIDQLLNNPDLEDQTEQRFAALLGGQPDQCPHKYVSREGGGNWEWIYFATEEQAQDVIAWIREGGSDKFLSGRAHYNGHTPVGTHCVHAHYDNERRVPHQARIA